MENSINTNQFNEDVNLLAENLERLNLDQIPDLATRLENVSNAG